MFAVADPDDQESVNTACEIFAASVADWGERTARDAALRGAVGAVAETYINQEANMSITFTPRMITRFDSQLDSLEQRLANLVAFAACKSGAPPCEDAPAAVSQIRECCSVTFAGFMLMAAEGRRLQMGGSANINVQQQSTVTEFTPLTSNTTSAALTDSFVATGLISVNETDDIAVGGVDLVAIGSTVAITVPATSDTTAQENATSAVLAGVGETGLNNLVSSVTGALGVSADVLTATAAPIEHASPPPPLPPPPNMPPLASPPSPSPPEPSPPPGSIVVSGQSQTSDDNSDGSSLLVIALIVIIVILVVVIITSTYQWHAERKQMPALEQRKHRHTPTLELKYNAPYDASKQRKYRGHMHRPRTANPLAGTPPLIASCRLNVSPHRRTPSRDPSPTRRQHDVTYGSNATPRDINVDVPGSSTSIDRARRIDSLLEF